ncbi:MAG: polysaccharide biosynthesis/export family protein [Gemmataceae bacterium]
MRRCGYLGLTLLASFLPVGCASPTKGGGILPGGNELSHIAASLRASTPPPPELPRELHKRVAEPYVVEPGDVLLVQPASLDSPLRLPGDQVVLPDGTIQLGKYGRLLAAGKPIDLIEQEVNALIKRTSPEGGHVIVRLATRDSKVFYVLGEVNAPGAFPLRGRETVLDAILAAGGVNSCASRRRIILTRPTSPCSCRVVLPVDFVAIVQEGDTTTNYQIRAGDRVFVPTKTIWEDLACLWNKVFHPGKAIPCCPVPDGNVTTYGAPAAPGN